MDIRNVGKAEEHNGRRRGWSHFELVFGNVFSLLYNGAEERLVQAIPSPTQIQPVVEGRREADKRIHQWCPSNARIEAWLKFVEEFGLSQKAVLTELGAWLICVFGTKDTFRANLFKRENAMTQSQVAASEPFTDKMRCAVAVMKQPGEVRADLKMQPRSNYRGLRPSLLKYLEATG